MNTLIRIIILLSIPILHLDGQIHLKIQKIDVDSLQKVLPSTTGAENIDVLNKLSTALWVDDTDSSISIAKIAIALSEKLDYHKGKADGLFNLGNCYYILDEFQPTINYYLKALRTYEDLDPSFEEGIVSLQLGDINSFNGRYMEAISYFNMALSNYRKLNHKKGKFRSIWLMAYHHWVLENYDSSFYFNDLGLSYLDSVGDRYERVTVYMHYARTCRQQFLKSGDTAKLDKTIQWLYKALEVQDTSIYQLASIYYNLGSYLMDYRNPEKIKTSNDYFEKVIPLVENCKDVCMLPPMTYRRKGILKYKQHKPDSALILLQTALELIERELSIFSIQDFSSPARAYEARWFLKRYLSYTYADLYTVSLGMKNYEMALKYYGLYEKSKEERYFEKNKNLISLLEADSENEKIEKQIALLAKDNELQKMKVAQSRIFNLGTAFIFIILGLLGLLFIRQNKLKNEHKSTLLEQKLLRLQMNPHFIFNAFSNILRLIDTNDNKKASVYLTTFGKLLRTTLESTREDMVPFEKEVGTLKNYLELQKLRFPEKFEYSLEVDEAIDQEDMSIPPMLVQPFIENAIEHGIRHKKTKGRIDVRYELKNKTIVCEIEDDGVGREKAWEVEYTERGDRKSLATEIIRDRIQVLNKKFKQKVKLEIIDLQSEKAEALGTKVLLELPYGSVY